MDQADALAPGLPKTLLDPAAARRAIERSIDRHLDRTRARIPDFTRRHFSLRGSLRIHRKALGDDLWRVPANIALAVPALGAAATAFGMRRLGLPAFAAWLAKRRLLLETDVAREISWLVHTELLQVPFRQEGRESLHDGLAAEILADPYIDAVLVPGLVRLGRRAEDPAFRARLEDLLAAYTGTRTAASEIAAGMVALGAGVAAFQKFTPGAMSLGTVFAAKLAQSVAVAGFPLGGSLGALWYAAFPAAAGPALTAAATGSIVAGMAVVAAFAGIVTDPVQNLLGLHQRRLRRLVDAYGKALHGEPARLTVSDHYFARLLDLLDMLRTAGQLRGA